MREFVKAIKAIIEYYQVLSRKFVGELAYEFVQVCIVGLRRARDKMAQ